jgi:hypothetical protein
MVSGWQRASATVLAGASRVYAIQRPHQREITKTANESSLDIPY